MQAMKLVVGNAKPDGPVGQTKRIVEVCMKHVNQALLFSAIIVVAAPVFAGCPDRLNAEQMIDCIVTENAGYFYVARGVSSVTQQEAIQVENEPTIAQKGSSKAEVTENTVSSQSE